MSSQGAILAGEDSEEESGSEGEAPVSIPQVSTTSSGEAGSGSGAGDDDAGGASPALHRERPDGSSGVELMAWSMSEVLRPTLQNLCARIVELQKTQQELITSLEGKRESLRDTPEIPEMYALMSRTAEYQAKIARIRKTMAVTSQKVASLKKQSAGWQSQIEKAASSAQARKEREKQIDKDLAAKPAAALVGSGSERE